MSLKIIFVLANFGVLVSTYLLWTYVTGSPIVCTTGGCEAVRASSFSRLLGVPLPAFGLLFYLGVIGVTFLSLLGKKVRRLLLFFSLSGFLFSAYLTFLEAFVIKAYCTWCLISALLASGIFVLSLKGVFVEKKI